jgi:hypothetical protein
MAFYSPRLGKLVLPTWYRVPSGVLVHEIVHALQDQHFETADHGTSPFLFDDRNLAAGMVLEGDAMRVESTWRKEMHEPEGSDGDLAQLPPTTPQCELPEELGTLASSVYEYGEHLATKRHESGSTLDEELKLAPQSTSQLLHWKGSEGTRRECDKMCTSRRSIVLGELTIRMLLKSAVPPKEATFAAHGWRADHVTIEGTSVVWETSWQTERDAAEFCNAYSASWSKRLGIPIVPEATGFRIADGDKALSMLRKGTTVTVRWE